MNATETLTFREVSIKAEKSGKCIVCGKKRKRTRKFWQTLNPYNKNPDGTVKNVADIMSEIQTEVRLWKAEPIDCCNE